MPQEILQCDLANLWVLVTQEWQQLKDYLVSL